MNSELKRLIDAVEKYNAPYWIILKGKDKEEYYEGSDLLTSISELEIAFNGLSSGKYSFKCREAKASYNSQIVRDFTKGINTNETQNSTAMDMQTIIAFTQTLAKIELRQEQMHNELKQVAESILKLHDNNKDNDTDGLSMLKNISEGVKVVGSLKDMFPAKS
jgi:predicted  nucleic acid-binding Zn-ribbon protein